MSLNPFFIRSLVQIDSLVKEESQGTGLNPFFIRSLVQMARRAEIVHPLPVLIPSSSGRWFKFKGDLVYAARAAVLIPSSSGRWFKYTEPD